MIENSEALHAVQRPLAEASHAPGFLYASADVYRLEVEQLFMRDWLYVARVEEVPNPGDYMTLRIAGEPIVIARDQAGRLSAFYNMCAHRGVEVAQGCGNAKAFKCPYHGWGYDLAGRLTGAAYMKESEGFALGDQRMQPIRLETWNGNVFVSFDPPNQAGDQKAGPADESRQGWAVADALLRTTTP